MRTVIAGGHGKIAMRVERMLAARGDEVCGLIRNPSHEDDVRQAGAWPILCDLERAGVEEVAAHLVDVDAVIFAAGAGPGSGAARKDTVDRAASSLLADAAVSAGVRRFVQISSMGAGRPPRPGTDEVWAAYIEAKTRAEDELRAHDLDWLILRPGSLTDEPGTGRVALSETALPSGQISRDDVTAVIAVLLDTPAVRHLTLELTSGDTPIPAAVESFG
ncbi:SDR family oxidoreductase [Streptosporangium sp. KLBMP 9127]|nr:SDR family oxidoreductase [Streptosporangium sp. KLBMP 9127]